MDTQNQYKTFKDLVFFTRGFDGASHARLDLGNDITISVVGGSQGVYGNGDDTWEVAFFQNDDFLPISKFDDVLGWQDEAQITKHMKEAQVNGNAWANFLKELRADWRKEMDLD